jgi:hypothetical protein
VWWFDRPAFVDVRHRKSDSFGVQKRKDDPRGERALEQKAFDYMATPWMSEINYPIDA